MKRKRTETFQEHLIFVEAQVLGSIPLGQLERFHKDPMVHAFHYLTIAEIIAFALTCKDALYFLKEHFISLFHEVMWGIWYLGLGKRNKQEVKIIFKEHLKFLLVTSISENMQKCVQFMADEIPFSRTKFKDIILYSVEYQRYNLVQRYLSQEKSYRGYLAAILHADWKMCKIFQNAIRDKVYVAPPPLEVCKNAAMSGNQDLVDMALIQCAENGICKHCAVGEVASGAARIGNIDLLKECIQNDTWNHPPDYTCSLRDALIQGVPTPQRSRELKTHDHPNHKRICIRAWLYTMAHRRNFPELLLYCESIITFTLQEYSLMMRGAVLQLNIPNIQLLKSRGCTFSMPKDISPTSPKYPEMFLMARPSKKQKHSLCS